MKVEFGQNIQFNALSPFQHRMIQFRNKSVGWETTVLLSNVRFKGKGELQGADFLHQQIAGTTFIIVAFTVR